MDKFKETVFLDPRKQTYICIEIDLTISNSKQIDEVYELLVEWEKDLENILYYILVLEY